MTDIVDRLRQGSCDPNTGCLPKTCGCAAMDEAADEIDRLRGTVMNLCVRIQELDSFIKTIEEQATALEEDNRKLRVEAGYD